MQKETVIPTSVYKKLRGSQTLVYRGKFGFELLGVKVKLDDNGLRGKIRMSIQ